MKIKKLQTPFTPIYKQELDTQNSGIKSLQQRQIEAEQQLTNKQVEQASKGDKKAQNDLKETKKKQRKRLREQQRKKQKATTTGELNLLNLVNTIEDQKDLEEIEQSVNELDPIYKAANQDSGTISDLDAINRAKTQQNLLQESYMTNPNGHSMYWNIDTSTPEGQARLNLATQNAAQSLYGSTAAAFSLGLPAASIAYYGLLPTATGLGFGIAGDLLSRKLASQYTDNPYYKAAAGALGGAVSGIALPTALSSTLKTQIVPRIYHYASPANYHDTGRPHSEEFYKIFRSLIKGEKINVNDVPEWVTDPRLVIRIPKSNDVIPNKAAIKFRDDAYRLALKLPERTKETAIYPELDGTNTYVQNSDGTYSFNMPHINELRTRYGGNEFTGEIARTSSGKTFDNITGNGGFVNVTQDSNGNFVMKDIFDVQPFLLSSALPFKNDKLLYGISKAMHKIYPKFEMISSIGGKPFTLKHNFNPTMDQFIGALNQSIDNSSATTITTTPLVKPFISDPIDNVVMRTIYEPWKGKRNPFRYPRMIKRTVPGRPDLLMGFTKKIEIVPKEYAYYPIQTTEDGSMSISEQAFDPYTFNVTSHVDPNSPQFPLYTQTLAETMKEGIDPELYPHLFKAYTFYKSPKSSSALGEMARLNDMVTLSPHVDKKGNIVPGMESKQGSMYDKNTGKFIKTDVPVYTGIVK